MCKKIKNTNDATILVPTNDAFLSLPPGELQKRMTDDGGRIVGLHFLDHPPGILADDVRVTKPQSDSGVSNKRITNLAYILLNFYSGFQCYFKFST